MDVFSAAKPGTRTGPVEACRASAGSLSLVAGDSSSVRCDKRLVVEAAGWRTIFPGCGEPVSANCHVRILDRGDNLRGDSCGWASRAVGKYFSDRVELGCPHLPGVAVGCDAIPGTSPLDCRKRNHESSNQSSMVAGTDQPCGCHDRFHCLDSSRPPTSIPGPRRV